MRVKKLHQLTGHRAAVFALEEAGHRHFFSGAGDGWVVRWDLDRPDPGQLVARVETNIFSMAYLPERATLVVGNMHGGLHWVNLEQADQTRNVLHHRKGVFAVRRVEDHIISLGGSGLLTRWSIDDRRAVESYQLSAQSLRALDYAPDRGELVVGASDNQLYFLDAGTLELKQTVAAAHGNSVFAVCYHPDGRHLLTGGRDAHLKVWDLDNDVALVSSQPAHLYTINSIAFHPKAPIFATASRDRTIKIWDARSFQLLKVVEMQRDEGHMASVNRLLWSGYDDLLISASDDRSIGIWQVDTNPGPSSS